PGIGPFGRQRLQGPDVRADLERQWRRRAGCQGPDHLVARGSVVDLRALPGTASDAEGESRRVGLVEPVPPALPGVTRQGQQSAARVAPGLPIDPDPGLVERAQTRKQRGACRLCATQRARDGRGHASSVGKLLYPGTQGWVRTDLEESP